MTPFGRLALRWGLLVAVTSAVATALYRKYLADVLDAMGNYYAVHSPSETWRQESLDNRLLGYSEFLPVLSASALFFAMTVRFQGRTAPFEKSLRSSRLSILIRYWPWWVVPLLLVSWAHFSNLSWAEYGFACWDEYCDYAQLFVDAFSGASRSALIAFMHSNYHSNSPFVPIVTGLLAMATSLPIVDAYRASCGFATLATVGLMVKVMCPRLGISSPYTFAAALLFGMHMAVLRSSFFPQTDAWVLLWTTLLLSLSLVRLERPRPWQVMAGTALLTSGLFIKLSFLPALAFLPLVEAVRAWEAGEKRALLLLRTVAIAAIPFTVVPGLVFRGFQFWAGTSGRYAEEFLRISTGDSAAFFVVGAVIQTAAFAVPLIGAGWKEFQLRHWMMGGWVLLYWMGIWASRASGWNRFYLATIPALVLLSIPGLRRLARETSPSAAVSYVALVIVLHLAALSMGLYQ